MKFTLRTKFKVSYLIFFILFISTSLVFLSYYYVFSLYKTENGWELGEKTDETFGVDVQETQTGFKLLIYQSIRNLDEAVFIIYLLIPFNLLSCAFMVYFHCQIHQDALIEYLIEEYHLRDENRM